MKNRSEVFTHFCAFFAEVKTQLNVSMHILRSDNAKEYMSELLQSYMSQYGVLHQSSCVDTSSQNRGAERKNRQLEHFLFQMKVLKQFWADAVSTTCFLINRMPSIVLVGNVPYNVIFSNKSLFPVEWKVFGSTCYVRPFITKLDPKALKCVFLGYSRLQKRYQCYFIDLGKYMVSTDVFSETTPFFYIPPISTSREEEDEWLVYQVTCVLTGDQSTIVLSALAPSAVARSPIVQVYSRRRESNDTCPAPIPLSSDPFAPSEDLDFPIALCKGVHMESPRFKAY